MILPGRAELSENIKNNDRSDLAASVGLEMKGLMQLKFAGAFFCSSF